MLVQDRSSEPAGAKAEVQCIDRVLLLYSLVPAVHRPITIVIQEIICGRLPLLTVCR